MFMHAGKVSLLHFPSNMQDDDDALDREMMRRDLARQLDEDMERDMADDRLKRMGRPPARAYVHAPRRLQFNRPGDALDLDLDSGLLPEPSSPPSQGLFKLFDPLNLLDSPPRLDSPSRMELGTPGSPDSPVGGGPRIYTPSQYSERNMTLHVYAGEHRFPIHHVMIHYSGAQPTVSFSQGASMGACVRCGKKK